MRFLGNTIGFLLLPIIVLAFITGPSGAIGETDLSVPVKFDGTYLYVNAKDVPLETLIRDIRNICGVETAGLENRLNDPVTLNVEKRAPETVFKRLLRQLGEDNYAFEFSNSKLKRVSVFPKSTAKAGTPVFDNSRKEFGTVVEIQSIIADSQAEELDLRPGDYVVEYDGTKITGSQELIREVKRKTDAERVDMKIVRDGEHLNHELKGGLIGIRINTKRIPLAEAEKLIWNK